MLRQRLILTLAILTLVAAVFISARRAGAEVAAPAPGGVTRVATYSYYSSGVQLEDESTYTAAPLLLSTGEDASRVADFHAVDIFVSADVSGTATLTTAVQYSADGINWADAYHTEVVGEAVTTVPYRLVQTADGTTYLRAPVVGLYLRLAFTAEGAVTPAARVVLRNN